MEIADGSIAETVGAAFMITGETKAHNAANVVDEEGFGGSGGGDCGRSIAADARRTGNASRRRRSSRGGGGNVLR